jgi:hypothetical protein
MSLTNTLLSGVEINQNFTTDSTPLDILPTYQEFYLPPDMERGSIAGEIRIPDLTGFSVLLDVRSGLGLDRQWHDHRKCRRGQGLV